MIVSVRYLEQHGISGLIVFGGKLRSAVIYYVCYMYDFLIFV